MVPVVVGMLALGASLIAAVTASSSPSRSRVPVYFLQGEQLLRVTRPGATPSDALHQLVAGPTRAEAKRGVRTYVPVGTQVHSVSVAGGVATVDLGRRFASGLDARSLLARLSQLVGTLTGLQGATKVKLLIDGRTVLGVFPGLPTQLPITFRYLQTPNVPVPKPPAPKLLPPDDHTRQVQQRLITLGFLGGHADGQLGPATANGILAFQKWERLRRTGSLDARTESRLLTATQPAPVSRGPRRQARRDLARPPGRVADQGQQGAADDCGLVRQAFDTHAARRLPRLREDPALVVDAVPRVASIRPAVRRRHCLP